MSAIDWLNPPDLREGEPANFEYWGKVASWTAEEAAALSFRIEPGWVESVLVGWQYPVGEDYKKLVRLVVRAQQAGQLPNPILPVAYIEWARATGVELPPELQASLVPPKLPAPVLKAALDDCRESAILLDFLFVVSVAFYGFDPTARRSRVVTAIKTDLDRWRNSLDQATILHWLRYAAKVQGKPVPPLDSRSRNSVCKLIVGILAGHYGSHPPANEIYADLVKANTERNIDQIKEAVRLARSVG